MSNYMRCPTSSLDDVVISVSDGRYRLIACQRRLGSETKWSLTTAVSRLALASELWDSNPPLRDFILHMNASEPTIVTLPGGDFAVWIPADDAHPAAWHAAECGDDGETSFSDLERAFVQRFGVITGSLEYTAIEPSALEVGPATGEREPTRTRDELAS
jgi:hypothetical protein